MVDLSQSKARLSPLLLPTDASYGYKCQQRPQSRPKTSMDAAITRQPRNSQKAKGWSNFIAHTSLSHRHHITTMNSVLQFPAVAFASITHSLKKSSSSTSACSSWIKGISMTDLPPQRNTHIRSRDFRPSAQARMEFRSRSESEYVDLDPEPRSGTTKPPLQNLQQPRKSTRPETYLCTFCWRPHHSAVTPSRVVGRHSRLACQLCYNALIDLAICWVCGEIVFRGDECVSLGWCFWHRACYGCLICGDKRVVKGVKLQELFEDDDEEEEETVETTRSKELDAVPLCINCVVEIGQDDIDDQYVIPMALKETGKFDSGLSRQRWEAKQQATRSADAFSSHLLSTVEHLKRMPSPVYVSFHDPFNEPTFRRSPTKPIPKWMRDLSDHRAGGIICSDSCKSLDDCSSNHVANTTTSISESDERLRCPYPPPITPQNVAVQVNPPTYIPTHTQVAKHRPFTLIAEEPVQRPSSLRLPAGHPAPVKHVRFDHDLRASLPSIGFLNATEDDIPSSTEYLDRYGFSSPRRATPSTPSIPTRQNQVDEGYRQRAGSPLLKRPHSLLSKRSFESFRKLRDIKGDIMGRQTVPVKEAVKQCSGINKDLQESDVKITEYLDSANAYCYSEALNIGLGVLGEHSCRRPSSLQDQLKRMFGFS